MGDATGREMLRKGDEWAGGCQERGDSMSKKMPWERDAMGRGMP